MYNSFNSQFLEILNDAANKAGFSVSLDESNSEFSEHADTTSKIAFELASIYKKSPAQISSEIVSNISIPKGSLVGEIKSAGPYINGYVSNSFFEKTVKKILDEKENYGSGTHTGKIILEHTSANPNGPLHVGHIRNSIIGDTLGRILKKAGFDVEIQYYINDIGRQIAVVTWACDKYPPDLNKKSDLAIAEAYIKANADIRKINDENESLLNESGVLRENYINVEIDELMKLVESGDKDTLSKFTKYVDMAISGIKETLLLMNVSHDKFVRESKFLFDGSVWAIIDSLKKTGLTQYDKEALVLDLSDYGFEKMLVIQRSNKTSLYTTRDIAYHIWKSEQSDRMINVFGADHKLISGQLCAALNVLGKPAPELVIFEFVSLSEGSMSTRRGKFISADDLLHEVISKAYDEVNERRPDTSEELKRSIAKSVGVGAVRYDIIRVSPEKSTVFDWNSALDFEKQGAPYIQYAYARASGILQKAIEQNIVSENLCEIYNFCDISDSEISKTSKNSETSETSEMSIFKEKYESDLIKKLSQFQTITEMCAIDLKAHSFATYARELADSFNQFYRFVPVLNEENEEVRLARISLVNASKIVIGNALDVLGIDALESM
ncbi:MAG: arginine--tRNA ligase [Methanosarcinaceae archaeon]|nr:arginine--tRNA ligase [Methanosarcinaceae archaeon]